MAFNTKHQRQNSWIDRAEMAAELILSADATSVADIGCGDRKLERILRVKGWTGLYHGYDVNPQGEGTLRFDATSDDLPSSYDVVAALGLIEYIPLLPFLRRVRRHCKYVVFSHVAADLPENSYTAEDRARLGWMTFATTAQIHETLAAAEFRTIKTLKSAEKKTLLWLAR